LTTAAEIPFYSARRLCQSLSELYMFELRNDFIYFYEYSMSIKLLQGIIQMSVQFYLLADSALLGALA
jgi:hypothetical protein